MLKTQLLPQVMIKEKLSITEARSIIAGFPDPAKFPRWTEAIKEIIGDITGLNIEISKPSKEELDVFETAAGKGISKLSLIYLPGYDTRHRYPASFIHRLSSSAQAALERDSLGVEPGWRVVDTRKIIVFDGLRKRPAGTYEDDEKFLGPIIADSRRAGDIYYPDDPDILDMWKMSIESRLALTPMEITTVIAPQVDSLLELPRGTMRLPTLREAMMASELYGLVPMKISEWQTARFSKKSANKDHPAGLEYSHDVSGSNARYYNPRIRSKHTHNPTVGFRLIGQL